MDEQHVQPHSSRHLWIMLLCCLVPLVALAAIYIFGVPVSQVLVFGIVLLCPLSHFLMMGLGGHQHGGTAQTDTATTAGTAGRSTSEEKQPACH